MPETNERDIPKEARGKVASIERLKGLREELEKKADAAEREREEGIREEIVSHDSLLTQAAERQRLLEEAQTTLTEHEEVQAEGQVDVSEEIEELRGTVATLQEEIGKINRRIADIAEKPEVAGKLQEEAGQEDKEREATMIEKEAHGELDPQIDQLAEEIKVAAKGKSDFARYIEKQREKMGNTRQRIEGIIRQVVGGLKKSELEAQLKQDLSDSRTVDEFLEKVQDRRSSLGRFKGTERKALDVIISQESIFSEVREQEQQLVNLNERLEEIEPTIAGFPERYREIIGKAWEYQDRVDQIEDLGRHVHIPSNFDYRLRKHIEAAADLKRSDSKGKEVGKYKGWNEAMTRNPNNQILYRIYEGTTKGISVHMREQK